MTPVTQLVEMQRRSIEAERAAIVRYLRDRLAHLAGPGTYPAEVFDAIAAGAHLYDGSLFSKEKPHASNSHEPRNDTDVRPAAPTPPGRIRRIDESR